MPETITPPPGYQLEQDNSSVMPPPGYKLEGRPAKPAGNFIERAIRPVDEALTEGSRMMYEGGKAAWNEPTWERKAKGVSQVIRGAGTALSPALAPAALANPVATAGRVGLGLLAQKGVEGGAKAVGVPEGYAELSGDVAGAGVAGIGPPSRAGLTTTARTLKGAATGAGEALANKSPAALVTGAMGAAAGEAVGGHAGSIIGGGIGAGLPAVRGAIRGGVKAYRNLPEQARVNMAPPAQTGSNNRTPLPAPPVTAPPPAQQGSNAPPIPPPRPQVAPPQQIGSNAPPVSPRRQAGPPAQQGSNNRTPPPSPTPEAGPPAAATTSPAVEPQPGPPQAQKPQGVPENEAFTGAGENTGKGTKESVIKGHRTVRGKQFGRYFRDEAGIPKDWPWRLGDPRFERVAKAAGTTPPNTPEALQILMDEVRNTPPKGSVEYAKGGVITGPPIGHYPAPPRQKWQGPPMTNWTPPPERTGPPARRASR